MHRIGHAVRMASSTTKNATIVARHTQYSHAKTGGFSQDSPTLHNPYTDDPILDRALRRLLPEAQYMRVAADLSKFGDRITSEIEHLGRQAELDQPRLEQQDAWGKRIDKLIVCNEWQKLKQICAEEGVISIGYENDVDPFVRRIHQVAKLFLFSPSAGLVSCPMAMTDGAVKTLTSLNLYGKHKFATEAVDRLRSRDPSKAWTSGQWMTEKKGGSDVAGGCDTYAVQVDKDTYRLHGYKWFSSAVDADVALTLARVVDSDGNAVEGSRGLSLFLLRIRDESGNLNGIQMVRLKNKLGTKQLPTAELLLDGAIAERIGEPGRGVAGISNMLNITRIHNAVASLGYMRRIISLARDYSTKRVVFGQTQSKWPLHTTTLAKMEVETRGSMLLLFESARLLGLSEAGKSSDIDAMMLRLITPVLKLYAGKQAVPLVSEGIECFGGQGYMEDTGLPTILRDAQVTPIWEGTTNVLSLDVLRVFSGKENILLAFGKRVSQLLKNTSNEPKLQKAKQSVEEALKELQKLLVKASDSAVKGDTRIDSVARHISFAIARIYSGSLLIDHASDSTVANPSDIEVAYRYCCEQPLIDLRWEWFSEERVKEDRDIVFDNYSGQQKSKI
uniref:Acyl-CoA dehydrogenase family member 11-like n=1 Tax=Caenorhabditis tropicalis TaxID=1561998 RepID=A0A1I7TMB9_9PELO